MRNRRAASVPAEDLSYRSMIETSGPFNKSYTISKRAVDDTDSLTAASRRHDADFLNDISNKLLAANLSSRSSQDSFYPGGVRSSTPSGLPPRPDQRRRTYSAAGPANDYEVNTYLSSGHRPQVNGYPRCTSVPPPHQLTTAGSRASVPRWFTSGGGGGGGGGSSSGGWAPRWTPAPGYNRSSREALAPYEDVVVGVAHTALYGDIVIGIPYNKRYMFNAQRESGVGFSGNYYQPSPISSRRSSITSNNPYSSSVPSKAGSYRRASFSAPYRNIYDDMDDDVIVPKTSHYLPTTVTRPHINSYDMDLDIPPRRPIVNSTNIHSTAGRNIGGYSGAYQNGDIRHSTPITGVTGGTSALPPRGTKPPVSEARRKVRNLLCRTKNDPHYFDF